MTDLLNCKIIIINLIPCNYESTYNLYVLSFIFDAAATVKTLQSKVEEKDLTCRKLKEQVNALEKETAVKLADMDQYKKEIQVSL